MLTLTRWPAVFVDGEVFPRFFRVYVTVNADWVARVQSVCLTLLVGCRCGRTGPACVYYSPSVDEVTGGDL